MQGPQTIDFVDALRTCRYYICKSFSFFAAAFVQAHGNRRKRFPAYFSSNTMVTLALTEVSSGRMLLPAAASSEVL